MDNNIIQHNQNRLNRWKNKLLHHPVFIIGNGPSLNNYNLNLIKDYFSIGLNRSYLKMNSTILLYKDKQTEKELPKKLNSILVSGYRNRFFNNDFGVTTLSYAFQLSVYLGCSPIILIACEGKYFYGKTNFYGKNKYHHTKTLNNYKYTLKKMNESSEFIIKVTSNNNLKYIFNLIHFPLGQSFYMSCVRKPTGL